MHHSDFEILIDDREKQDLCAVWLSESTSRGMRVAVKRLAVGDIAIRSALNNQLLGVLFERKSENDLVASMISKHLDEQFGRMVTSPFVSLFFLVHASPKCQYDAKMVANAKKHLSHLIARRAGQVAAGSAEHKYIVMREFAEVSKMRNFVFEFSKRVRASSAIFRNMVDPAELESKSIANRTQD